MANTSIELQIEKRNPICYIIKTKKIFNGLHQILKAIKRNDKSLLNDDNGLFD